MSQTEPKIEPGGRPWRTVGICAGLLLLYAVLTYSAALTKCATFDENVHIPAAWAHLALGDFRVNPEHPPLWKYWAGLPLLATHVDDGAPRVVKAWFDTTADISYQWNWAAELLYRTKGNDADAIVNRARFMMVWVAVGLGAFVAWWAYRIGGSVAAIGATLLFALDPNFAAHGALVTNDVAFSLVTLALAWALWRVGERATAGRILTAAGILAVGVTVKFSALLLGPLMFLVLMVRAAAGGPWKVLGRELTSAWRRAAAAVATCVLAAGVCYVVIWAAYLFRYSATPDPNTPIGWIHLIEKTRANELYSKHPGVATTSAEFANWKPSALTRGILYAHDHRLLPEAFLFGVLHVHMGALVRWSFLLGELSQTGWWYYFPLAMLFKTPTATLVAILAGTFVLVRFRRALWSDPGRRWLTVCLVLPPAYYLAASMNANLNLGLRHVFPVYPFVFIGLGLAAAKLWELAPWRRAVRAGAGLLVAGLAAESLAAWPNYIPFFNVPSGGSRNGVHLLGDSNIDWGQDLKLLARWQRERPQTKVYLLYFGIADPSYYGIKYTNMPGGYGLGPEPEPATTPGVFAVSASHMQGINIEHLRQTYGWMMRAEPAEVLGGSIYLFEFPYHGPMRPE